MKNKIVVENVDELFSLFEDKPVPGDTSPYVGNKDIRLEVNFSEQTWRLVGDDAWMVDTSLLVNDDIYFLELSRVAFARLGIHIEAGDW